MSLEKEDIERLKDIFVEKDSCNIAMNAMDEKVNKEDTRLAVIEHRLGNITWLIMTVVGGVVTIILKLFSGG